jgi:hypothetical protein
MPRYGPREGGDITATRTSEVRSRGLELRSQGLVRVDLETGQAVVEEAGRLSWKVGVRVRGLTPDLAEVKEHDAAGVPIT